MKRPQKPTFPTEAADTDSTEVSPQERLIIYLRYAVPEVSKISPMGAQLLQLVIDEIGGGPKVAQKSARH
jgi:hypothetical protein